MRILTAHGSFAEIFLKKYDAEVISNREFSDDDFAEKISQSAVIIHNASTTMQTDLDTYLKNNFDSTRSLIKHLKTSDTHIIILSSMSILSPGNSMVYDNPLQMTPYAYSKYLSETYAMKSEMKNVSCVRFSTIFYMNQNKDGLSKLIHDAVTKNEVTIYNSGDSLRDFIPLDVAVDYVEKIAKNKSAGKKTYTIASGKEISFAEVTSILKKHIPDLKILNIKTNSFPPVLSKFHTTDVDQLGIIDFKLENYIVEYMKKIMK